MRIILLLFGLAVTALAQDPQLAALRSTVLDLRASREDFSNIPYAALTKAKQQLRGWIEASLTKLAPGGDPSTFTGSLNAALAREHLTCDQGPNSNSQSFCPEGGSLQGYLAPVQLKNDPPFVVFTTSIGILECRYDQSVYVYERVGTSWKRVLRDEPANAGREYEPETIRGIEISKPAKDGSRSALVLGSNSGCSSVLRPIYYRVWKFGGPFSAQKLLLGRAEQSDISGPLLGRVSSNDILVEFTAVNSVVDVAFRHAAIRHYSLTGDALRQIDPVALTPVGFLNEWVALNSKLGPLLSEATLPKALYTEFGGFGGRPKRCQTNPEFWEMEVGGVARQDPIVYILFRWKKPYSFSVADIKTTPRADCTIEAPIPEESESLFGRPN